MKIKPAVYRDPKIGAEWYSLTELHEVVVNILEIARKKHRIKRTKHHLLQAISTDQEFGALWMSYHVHLFHQSFGLRKMRSITWFTRKLSNANRSHGHQNDIPNIFISKPIADGLIKLLKAGITELRAPSMAWSVDKPVNVRRLLS